ncbi:MAG: transcription elongation factor subunit Spt4 [Candidatus Hodarchaeales archaeon]
MTKQKACKQCHTVVEDGKCPICNEYESLSPDFSGIIIILDPEDSDVAKRLNINRPGTYAIRVR